MDLENTKRWLDRMQELLYIVCIMVLGCWCYINGLNNIKLEARIKQLEGDMRKQQALMELDGYAHDSILRTELYQDRINDNTEARLDDFMARMEALVALGDLSDQVNDSR